MLKTFKQLEDHTGTLSDTSKMPCFSTSTPAKNCNVGSYMRTIKGTVCADCYGFEKGNYQYPSVIKSLENRLEKITGPHWVEAMIIHLKRRCDGLFRWHDVGDVQSAEHLRRIIAVADGTPDIKHWLPTKEYKLILNYLRHGNTFPSNLIVRVSAPMVGKPFGWKHKDKKMQVFQQQFEQLVLMFDVQYSTVSDDNPDATCPAPEQEGECGNCRRCWSDANCVNYIKH